MTTRNYSVKKQIVFCKKCGERTAFTGKKIFLKCQETK